jgi:hypothetical protein
VAVADDLTRWEKWTGAEGVALSSVQMHRRTSEDLDQHDRDFADLRADIKSLRNMLAAAALSFVVATATLWLTYLGGPQ